MGQGLARHGTVLVWHGMALAGVYLVFFWFLFSKIGVDPFHSAKNCKQFTIEASFSYFPMGRKQVKLVAKAEKEAAA
jgi:hypothetical protein